MNLFKNPTRPIGFVLNILVVLGCFLVLFISCEKPPLPGPQPQLPALCDTCLPAITTQGLGTFGCRVNGKPWLPKGSWGNPSKVLRYNDELLNIYGYNTDYNSTVAFSFKVIKDTGYYNLESYPFKYSEVAFSPKGIRTDDYNSNPAASGYLHILHFDPFYKGIISGTFAFDAFNDAGDTVHITDGRFDFYF